MSKSTTDFIEFLDNETFKDTPELVRELYYVADGREGGGTYRSEQNGRIIIIYGTGNPYHLILSSENSVEAFKTHIRMNLMDGADNPEIWKP
ncbi:hypothetical protein [Methylobacterium sp. J-077]|uniref:hypothetical protein n=1 Tax=Methylobacterium sp. J-077 TaxID=2836656 RepID=UPI001FBB3641|nr:hypothetical protein [Methylobacterium sp. J-077]MCJ2126990.1 hypothetical protein [Methylobacterium sp. J-077]